MIRRNIILLPLIVTLSFLLGNPFKAFCQGGEAPGFGTEERGTGPAAIGLATYFADGSYTFEGTCKGTYGIFEGTHSIDWNKVNTITVSDFIGSRDEVAMELDASGNVPGDCKPPTYTPVVTLCDPFCNPNIPPPCDLCLVYDMVIMSAHDLEKIMDESGNYIAMTINVVTLFAVPK